MVNCRVVPNRSLCAPMRPYAPLCARIQVYTTLMRHIDATYATISDVFGLPPENFHEKQRFFAIAAPQITPQIPPTHPASTQQLVSEGTAPAFPTSLVTDQPRRRPVNLVTDQPLPILATKGAM